MTTTTKPTIADRVRILAEFCETHTDHIHGDNLEGARLGYYDSSVQISAGGNASRAVLFALDGLDSPRVRACLHESDVHLNVSGSWRGEEFSVVSIAIDADAQAIEARLEWTDGQCRSVDPAILRDLATEVAW